MITNGGHGYFLRTRPCQINSQEAKISDVTSMAGLSAHHLRPDPFAGLPSQDAGGWYIKFQAWIALNEWQEKPAKVANGLRLLLVPPASTWFDGLDDAVKNDVAKLCAAFHQQFVDNQPAWVLEQQLWSRIMQPSEGLDSYITAIDTLCSRLRKGDSDRTMCFVRGLTPALRPFVIQQDPKTFTAAVQAARLAQESLTVSASPSTVAAVSTPSLQDLVQEQRNAIDDLRQQLASLQMSPPVVATTTAPDVTGQLCANVGHAARECRRYRQEVAAL